MIDLPRSYAAYAQMRRDAIPSADLWRVAVGVLIVFLVTGFSNALTFIIAASVGVHPVAADGMDILIGHTPGGMFFIFAAFAFMTGACIAVAQMLHQRNARSLIGDTADLRRDFIAVAKWVLAILVIVSFLPSGYSGDLVQNMPVGSWLLFAPVAVICVGIQISAEEILFRGYIQSQLSARFRSPLVWIGVPSALFAVSHITATGEGGGMWMVVLWAFAFGLAASDLTARTGNLGAAMALHFLNNVSAAMFVAVDGYMSGFALYLFPYDQAEMLNQPGIMVFELVVLLIFWLAARVALRR